MKYLMGVDIGTSGTKTVLFDQLGDTIASSVYEYPMYQPKSGWAEQDPNDWWQGVKTTMTQVIQKSKIDPNDIKGVGLSGQMHGLVLLDKKHEVLRKSIIWCDQRTHKECEEITEKIGKERLIEITANPALTGFTASKILWVKNHEPEIYEKVDKILLPKDYIRYRLTGEFATEVSDASGMQLMDIKKREWSQEVLDKLEIDRGFLAKMYESSDPTGTITENAAKETGLVKGTIVAGGAGDQAAGAVGNGIVEKGIVSSTIGTSGVVFAHADQVQIDPLGRVHTFCHAVKGAWHIMGVTQAAGLSLKWFRDEFCLEEKRTAQLMDVDPYVLMDQEAEKIDPGSEGLLYLPYLMGERTPHLDPHAKGVFFGLSGIHTKAHMTRAILEGVVYSLRDCLEIIKDMDIEVSQVRASGGGGRSPLWRQMQADNFKTQIACINSSEGPALGVAILAGVACGIYSDVVSACKKIIKVTKTQECNETSAKVYHAYYAVYKDLYVSLKEQYQKVYEIGEN